MSYTDRQDLNYLGRLFLIGANQTPFLNMIGGITGGGGTTTSFNFPIAQPWALRAADQATAVKSEATSVSDVTEITYTRGQDFNTCQIMKYPYGVSFAKQSTHGEVGAITVVGSNPNQPVKDEFSFQRTAALKQMSIDLEYSFLQGSYVAQATAATVAKTRGIIAACSTNTVAGGSAALTTTMVEELLREMAGNGAQWGNMVAFCGAYQKQAISKLYGYAPESRNVGGVNINQIETDFCQLGVVWDPFMPTSTILIADMSVVKPMFCPYKGKIISDIPVATTTAKEGGFLYSQVGLDYGPEEYHGTLTGLATS